jgi:hypothetical protein
MPLGWLIFPQYARISRLDTVNTDYDHTLKEPRVLPTTDIFNPVGVSTRVDAPTLDIPVQVMDYEFEQLRSWISGDSAQNYFFLTTDRYAIERAGLMREDGQPMLGKQDRLDAIRDKYGNIMLEIPLEPGLYLQEIRPRSFGMSIRNPRRQLYFLYFRSRDLSEQE